MKLSETFQYTRFHRRVARVKILAGLASYLSGVLGGVQLWRGVPTFSSIGVKYAGRSLALLSGNAFDQMLRQGFSTCFLGL